MTEKKSYDRRDNESDAQWLGFTIYRDLGSVRTMTAAYHIYLEKTGRSAKRSTEVSGVSSSFRRWSKESRWDDRVRDWDLDEEARFREVQIREGEERYVKELQEFRELQISSGKLGVQLALKIKSDLAVFCNIQKPNPKTRTIASLTEAERYARILSSIEAKSTEQWSKGLSIEELMKVLTSSTKVPASNDEKV